MKIAQLTFNVYNNYGNILQKYALQRVLHRYAQSVDAIWHSDDQFLPETWEWNWRPQLAKMLNSHDERRRFTFELIRQSKFREFHDRHIQTRYNVRALDDIADEYDFFVVGSDQVWNPTFSDQFFPGRFLLFVPPRKRIAYAASIALPQLPPQYRAQWKRGLEGMAHISVREKNAATIVEELIGRAPPVVPDPIFLLTADEWSEVSQLPAWFDERYERGFILTYFLGKPPLDMSIVSARLGLPVVNLFRLDVFNHYNVGPAEFLCLAARASLICTNSFHGTAFSILFERPFVMCDFLDDGMKIDRSSRLYSLLEDFDLMSRRADRSTDFQLDRPLEIDYSRRDEVLTRERSKAKQFLDGALRGVDRED